MAPETATPFAINVSGNGYSGTLSPDAAGVVASLFGINRIASLGDQRAISHYYLLEDFAVRHPAHAALFRAID